MSLESNQPSSGDSPSFQWPALLVAGFLLGVMVCWRITGDPDAFWHLATGRLAAETGSSLPFDPFSWSQAGAPWRVKDLGGDLLLWGAYSAASFSGVALLGALFFLPLPLALQSLMPRRTAAWGIFFGAIYLGAVSMSATPRPRLFTLALFPVALVLLEQARMAAQHRVERRELALRFAAVWLLVVSWLQLHRGGLAIAPLLAGLFVYLVVARLTASSPLFAHLLGPAPSRTGLLASALLLTAPFFAALVHPSGFELIRSTFGVMNSDIYRQHVSEFQPISLAAAWEHFAPLVLLALAALCAAIWALVQLWRGASQLSGLAWPAAVVLLFAAQAPGSVRWLPYLAAASILLLVWVAARLTGARPPSAPARALLAASLLGLLLIHAASPHRLGIGPSDGQPDAAIRFAREHDLGPRVHNAFHFGGYLIWAGAPALGTLIDGRNDMVFDAAFFLRCVTAEDDPVAFRALEADFPSDWVLAANPGVSPAFGFLDADRDFVPLFWSEPATIYARRGRYPALEKQALRFIRPSDPVGSLAAALKQAGGNPAALSAIEDELLRMQAVSPEGVQANALPVLFYASVGAAGADRRDAFWSRLQQLAPDHPAVVELGRRLGLATD